MYLVKDIGGAIGLMAAALVLLGTWPVVLAVLERRGRLRQHTYLDYSITNFLAAVLIALTFGQIGGDTPETPNFLTQLTQPQVVRCCLEHAASVAKTFITSDAVVVDIRVPKCTPVVNPMCGSGYGF